MMGTAPAQAGENVRREHARGVGADVVVGIFRLVKLTQVHDLENEAMHRQIEETVRLVREYCLQAGADVNVLFARRAVFLAGQLLRGSRADYESAIELGEILDRLGGAELTVTRDVSGDDLRSFAEAVAAALTHGRPFQSPSPRVRLRKVTDAARVRGLEVETLDYEQRLVRTYASAVVVLRRFFEQLARGDYSASRHLKRIGQTLADLSAGPTMAFLGVTEARNANHDEAGRAANSAILAVATTRQITDDRATLAQVAMAAMVQDVGRPRAAASNAAGPRMSAVTARLTDEQEDQLPAGTAAVLTALGRLNDATVTRTVVAYEALWLRRRTLGAVYGGARRPALQARIVAIARRYNDLLTPEPGVEPLSSDRAIATLQLEFSEPTDRTVLRALVAALCLFPVGTVVQLSTGEVGEVVASGPRRAPERPRVRVAVDASGGAVETPYELDLDAPAPGQPARHIARVVSVEGWRKALVPSARPRMTSEAPSVPSVSVPSVSTVQPVAHDPGPISSQPPRSSPITMPDAGPPSLKLRTPLSPIGPANASFPPSAPLAGVESTIVQKSPFEDDSDQQPTRAVPSPLREAPPSRPPPLPAGVPRKVLVRTRDPYDDANATARGTLSSTPLVHVLVYVLDHGLSGMVTLREPDEVTSTIAFGAGAPEKIRSGRPIGRLGEILAAHGLVAPERAAAEAEAARRMGRLVGEVLLSRGALNRESLDWALRRQVVEKLASLVNAPGDTRYSFHRDVNGLKHWPTVEAFPANPLEAILACVRAWENRAHIHDTLARFSSRRLSLHPAAEVAPFNMTEEEQALVDAIRREEPTFSDVQRRRGVPDEVAASLVYALTVTRHLAIPGQNRGPMGLAGEEHVSADGDRLTPLSPVTPPPVSVRQPISAPPVTVPSPAPPAVAPAPSPAPSRPAPVSARRPEPPPAATLEVSDDEDAEAERALRAMEDMRLAEAAFQRGETATAQRLAEKALASTPEDADVRALVAWLRSIGGQADAVAESLAELGRILDEDPAHERSLLYRGRVYKRAGKARDAARDFEALLDVNPRHSEAASELRLLRSKKR